jgi:CxxC motif-containing protein
MKKDMICISCPIGCRISAEWENDSDIIVTGNKCQRGVVYGREEILSPRRIVSATMEINSSLLGRIPVMTNGTLPKGLIDPLLNKIYKMHLETPMARDDIIIKNIANTGIDLIATRTVRT